jgi:hypothetical protein
MTVCIAALADLGKSLVMVCDSMLSSGDFSGDRIANKMYPLSDCFQWWALVAASDVTRIPSLVDAVIRRLLSLSDSTNTVETVERAAVEAYQSVRTRYAADLVLSPIGLTMEQFVNRGEWHPQLAQQLAAVNLGCEVLVAGFDFAGDGSIFTVEHPVIVRNHNLAGWTSIGSGSYSAIGTLLHHSVNYSMELPRVLYHACEAKFMAESADGVGKHTVAKVASGAYGKMDAYEASEALIRNIRTAWERDGKPRVPAGVIEHLADDLKKHPTIK